MKMINDYDAPAMSESAVLDSVEVYKKRIEDAAVMGQKYFEAPPHVLQHFGHMFQKEIQPGEYVIFRNVRVIHPGTSEQIEAQEAKQIDELTLGEKSRFEGR